MRIKAKLTGINRTLFELETGILLFGLVCQSFVFFMKDKTGYSLGLWIGLFTAMGSAFHMWWSLDRALDYPERQAVKSMSTQNVFRYVLIVAVFTLVCTSRAANPLSAFLGIMGLKASAYMHSITHRIGNLVYGEEVLPPLNEEPANEQDM